MAVQKGKRAEKQKTTRKGKTTNALMRHIRTSHHLKVNGSTSKKMLLDMGYFHGYKAYRITYDNHDRGLSRFEQIEAIHDFDNSLKAILYPIMMKVETALKNRTIAIIVKDSDPSIDAVFNNSLARYGEKSIGSSEYRKQMTAHLRMKKRVDGLIAERYSTTPMIQHYVHKGETVPIWAIFELFTMGDFGQFLNVMSKTKRTELATEVGVYDPHSDTDATFIARHVFILKDLRNAIAHNSVVFDCRFKSMSSRNTVSDQLANKTRIKNINFRTITDYIVLLVYYLKFLKTPKGKITRFIKDFELVVQKFKKDIDSDRVFNQILSTEINSKLSALKDFI